MKTIIATLLACITISAFGQIPTDNLQAHYSFSGDGNDASTNSNHANIVGPQLTMDRFDAPGNAYSFDGIDDRIVIPHDPSIDFDALADDYSISMWVRSGNPKLGADGFRLLEKRFTGQSTEGYPIGVSGGNIANDYSTNFITFDGSNQDVIEAGDSFWDTKWHHLVWIVDNTTGEMRSYLDGTFYASMPLTHNMITENDGDLVFGNSYTFLRPYHGDMDDIRIYSDVLTTCEVFALYMEDVDANSTESVTVCYGDNHTLPDGTLLNNVTTDQTHVSTITSVHNGCDSSTVTTNIVVHSVDLTVTQTEEILTAPSTSSSTYQWVDCDDSNVSIPNATNSTYTATENGSYAVIIDDGTCSETSACLDVTTLQLAEISHNEKVKLSPNPFNEQTTLRFGSKQLNRTVVIFNSLGQEVRRTENVKADRLQISKGNLETGIYLVSVINSADQRIMHTARMVVR